MTPTPPQQNSSNDRRSIPIHLTLSLPEEETRSISTITLQTIKIPNTDTAAAPSSTPLPPASSPSTPSSSLLGCTFNFTNSIIGAGALGLGGAIAASGGLIGIACIVFFGALTKLSLDLLISLTVRTENASNYEELGYSAFGSVGRWFVILSKTMYSLGCLVAYTIVVRDNMASGLLGLIYGGDYGEESSWLKEFLKRDDLVTVFFSAKVILPLSLLRDMAPLEKFSIVSIVSMVMIVTIVVYLFFANPGGEVRVVDGGDWRQNWLEIRPGLFQSLGSFIFTFVSQHTVHLAYTSLHPTVRTVQKWKIVSLASILMSSSVSLSIGVFVYMTFWDRTESDIFQMYPPGPLMDSAKVLLCVVMMLTFPLPFFSCRQMLIVICSDVMQRRGATQMECDDDLRISLLEDDPYGASSREERDREEHSAEERKEPSQRFMAAGKEHQLVLPYHILVTVLLWGVVTTLAIFSPSLGDVLNVVGCASGTMIAFILPGLFSLKLTGYSHLATLILAVGGIVGAVGTYFSLHQLIVDVI